MRSLTILLLTLIAFFGTVEAQLKYEIKGKWAVDAGRTFGNISAVMEKSKYDKMSVQAKNHMKSSFEGRTFDFAEDNSISIKYTVNNNPRNADGQWTFEHIKNELTITISGTTKSYDVQWESKDRILLIYKNHSAGELLKSLYLTRSH